MFTVIKSEASEVAPDHLSPAETAQINAHRKARVVATLHPDSLVLGADTVVSLGTEIYGKPADIKDAERMLTSLQGRTHQVITGVCLLRLRPSLERMFAVSTEVTFRELRIGQIRDYLARIDPFDKAGAYAIQDDGDLIVKSRKGSFSNVVGLPVERLGEELRRMLGDPAG